MLKSITSKIQFGLLGLSLSLTCASSAFALEINQIKIEPQQSLANKELVLNGAGVRSVLFAKAYVAALYLPEKTDNPGHVIAAGPRKMVLHAQGDEKKQYRQRFG
jgi:hypothetical protein